ncbi:MAG: hypothetical protein JXI32_06605 [Deltaproteobacteria bacterium]|nr:hypothetical protein [Deltaproteobacteria bacterium]
MKPSTKAALLSGLVFPGTGQIYLKRLRRGIIIMICAASGIGAIAWPAVVKALAILDQLERHAGRIDMETVSSLARTAAAGAFPHSDLVLLFIVCCWLFSIGDAYRTGRREEQPGDCRGV